MNVIVVGCGRVGAELAYRLYQSGHDVVVVDIAPLAFKNLPADFKGRMIEGEGMNKSVLRRAGIEQADALAAVTNSDSLNAVVAHIARVVYQVPTVVVRNYDPERRSLLEAFGLQVVSSSSWGAQRIEELLTHGISRMVFSAGNGEVEIYEIMVPKQWHERPLGEVLSGEGIVVVALTRAGRAVLPDAGTVLAAGDVVHISANRPGIEEVNRRLHGKQEA